MTDEEAHEFYKNPANLRVVGPGRRRKADMLTEIKSVRFSSACSPQQKRRPRLTTVNSAHGFACW